MTTREFLLKAIADQGYEKRPEPFVLKSGEQSHEYVDLRKVFADPLLLNHASQLLNELILCAATAQASSGWNLLGVATGAIGLSAVMATNWAGSSQPRWGYVRAEDKTHGRGQRVEGDPIKGAFTVLIEDVRTSGQSMDSAGWALFDAGCPVDLYLAVLTRKPITPGNVHALFTLDEVRSTYREGRK